MAKTTAATKAEDLKVLEKKWSPELIAAGWTVLPAALIEHQRALGLDAIDINIILHLANRWWTADNRPMPSKKLDSRSHANRPQHCAPSGSVDGKGWSDSA